MRPNRFSMQFTSALATLGLVLFATSARAASHQILHSFHPNGSDAAYSYAGLISDAAGNRYGTSYNGGTDNVGAVFELSPNGSGGWTEKVLYSFSSTTRDGSYPEGGLVLDGAGNLYGTTQLGGIHSGGTMFELSPNGSGGWTETVLHSFGGGTDGYEPYASLIFDGTGNLYSTTLGGGIYGGGTVFEFSPRQGGGWTETVLHSFNPNSADGYQPEAALVRDAGGNLYSTTAYGGIHGYGTAFEISPSQGGGWTETVIHSFGNGTDGSTPYASLILDGTGNLYSTTNIGGIHGQGAVFKLSPHGSGGWTETVIHSFGNGTDGSYPYSGLITDGAGNLFGTTSQGGIHTFGTVFELSPNGSGGWSETVLHSFNFNGTDGILPEAGLIFDSAGNLYSTTYEGGTGSVGTVFELSPRQGGGWTEAVLYSFRFEGTDGADPVFGSLISDSAGNLYGTTYAGGTYDSGTVFELTPNGGGSWTEKVLYNFGRGTDASNPYAGVIFDNAGNLYGTTFVGGIHNYGAVFELSPSGGGWTEKVLHSFNLNGSDGSFPFDGVVFDAFGNLYGTTYNGGIHGYGTVFELTPNGSGGWTEKVLHSFNYNGTDAALPFAGLIVDSAGNLFGTTAYGGIHYYGAAFELSPNGSGGWTEKILHSFNYNGTDGAAPYSSLILDSANNLYGTTAGGGIYFGGTVFQLTPQQNGSWSERVLHSFNVTNGSAPDAGLVRFGSLADLYGTTGVGGVNGAGTVFELTPTQGGNWIETVLHNFSLVGGDGNEPEGGLIFDTSGNLYGMTQLGGAYNSGAVFEITP